MDDISGLSTAAPSLLASIQITASEPLKVITPGALDLLFGNRHSLSSCNQLLVLCSALQQIAFRSRLFLCMLVVIYLNFSSFLRQNANPGWVQKHIVTSDTSFWAQLFYIFESVMIPGVQHPVPLYYCYYDDYCYILFLYQDVHFCPLYSIDM